MAQDSGTDVKVLYKIIIGSSVTFPFTSNSIRTHSASSINNHKRIQSWKLFSCCLPAACIFFRTMYTPRPTAHGPRWGTHLPLLSVVYYCFRYYLLRVTRFFCFSFFRTAPKTFECVKRYPHICRCSSFALCVPANVCIGIISLIRMGAARAHCDRHAVE